MLLVGVEAWGGDAISLGGVTRCPAGGNGGPGKRGTGCIKAAHLQNRTREHATTHRKLTTSSPLPNCSHTTGKPEKEGILARYKHSRAVTERLAPFPWRIRQLLVSKKNKKKKNAPFLPIPQTCGPFPPVNAEGGH